MIQLIRKTLTLVCAVLAISQTALAQPDTVNVLISTNLGEIEVMLNVKQAPITATNFLNMADGGHFDGGSFYRTVTHENDNGSPKIQVIQGGRNYAPNPFAPIAHESTDQTGILHTDGVISMARFEVGTAGTEFFICIGDQPGLDHGQPRNDDGQGFAAFGKVVRGMDVVRAINSGATQSASDSEYTVGQILAEPVIIESVTRI